MAQGQQHSPDEDDDQALRRIKKRDGFYADCPHCGCPGDAKKIWYSWRGGFVGPALIAHVRCNKCGTAYNGASGNFNTTWISIYVTVVVLIGLLFVGAVMMDAILR
jgi:hypothetical protein